MTKSSKRNRALSSLGAAVMLAPILANTAGTAFATTPEAPQPKAASAGASLASQRLLSEVAKPFVAVDSIKHKGKTFTAAIADNSVVHINAPFATTVKMSIVKTGNKKQPQSHNKTIALKPGVNKVTGLISGRTYKIVFPGTKGVSRFMRITPMQKANAIGTMRASFGNSPREAKIALNHTAAWSTGGQQNTEYGWAVSTVHQNGKTRSAMPFFSEYANGRTNMKEFVANLPEEGWLRFDVATVNPLGASNLVTMWAAAPIDELWAAGGAGSDIPLTTTSPFDPVLDAVSGFEETDEVDETDASNRAWAEYYGDQARGNAGAAGNAANNAAKAAEAAANASDSAAAEKHAEEASRQAAIARDRAAAAKIDARIADEYKNQIPGPSEHRIPAEKAAETGRNAADAAADAADTASASAAKAWREVARIASEEARALSNAPTTIEAAETVATRAERAAANSAKEASRVDGVNSPAVKKEADQAAIEARDFADIARAAAEASKAKIGLDSATEGTALTPVEADAQAKIAETAALTAKVVAVRSQVSDTAKTIVNDDTELAEQRAAAARQAANDVLHRDAAQRYAREAEAARVEAQGIANEGHHNTGADSSALSDGTARDANEAARAEVAATKAETAAINARNEANLVTPDSDEEAVADAAADAAEAAAREARAYADKTKRETAQSGETEAKEWGKDAEAATDSQIAFDKAKEAATAAEDARKHADAIANGSTEKAAAEAAAQAAKAAADEAWQDALDTEAREEAQAAEKAAQEARDRAISEGRQNAIDARDDVKEARRQADIAKAARDDIDPSNDEYAEAARAAESARQAAIAAEEGAMATQALLNTQVAVVAQPTVDLATGRTEFTFRRIPSDERDAIDYVVVAKRGDTLTPGTVTENADGTVTVVFGAINGDETQATEFQVTPVSWERTSKNPTTVAPQAPSEQDLSALLSMQAVKTDNDTCETANAPGTLQGEECVTEAPLRFDTRAYEYPTTPLTNRHYVSQGYNETYQSGTETYVSHYDIVYGTRPVYSTRRVGKMCQSGMMAYDCSYDETYQSGTETYDTGQRNPVYATRPTFATRWVDTSYWACDAAPAGWTLIGDCNNGHYKRNTQFGVDEDAYEKGPNLRGARAVVDPFFSDTTWTDNGSMYVANKPRPASEINNLALGIFYKYEAASNTYVARTNPDHYTTWKPTFSALPSTVTGWTVAGKTHRGLEGQDTGRYSQSIVVHTLGGNVTIQGAVDSRPYRPTP